MGCPTGELKIPPIGNRENPPYRQPTLEAIVSAWYNTGNTKDGGKMDMIDNEAWASLTPEEKKRQLYERQKAMLQGFLERNAISKEQYDKSLGDLTVKMGYENDEKE